MINNWNDVIPSIDLPSGYLLHSHGIDGPFSSMVYLLKMALFHGHVT